MAPAPGCHRGLEGVVSARPTRLPGCGCVAAGVCGRLWGGLWGPSLSLRASTSPRNAPASPSSSTPHWGVVEDPA